MLNPDYIGKTASIMTNVKGKNGTDINYVGQIKSVGEDYVTLKVSPTSSYGYSELVVKTAIITCIGIKET